jgi:uncharacterized sodium:solute symporter family permease YidK
VPVGTIFSGIMLLNLFYWCTNQQIIQRTFGARSLAEGQKGVLLTGGLKLLGPLYLVFPGIVFAYLVIMMLVIGELKPRKTEFVQEDVNAVDMTPWKYARVTGMTLVVIVLIVYICFADFSILN